MLSGSDWANLLGRCLLAGYFLKAGINNTYHWNRSVGLIRSKKVPLPHLSCAAVVILQILGSIAIIANYYVVPAALLLIAFTLTVNVLVCHYWTLPDPQRKMVSFVFYANLAVVGALFLLIGTSTLNS